MLTSRKSATEVDLMRTSGKMLATVLEVLSKSIKDGISTKELADIAKSELKALGGKPTCLGYQGFPDVICISVNEQVVHGIPRSSKIIHTGDIVGLDFGVTYQGMITDSAISLIVGKSNAELDNLLNGTREALFAGISVLKNGIKTGDIGAAIEAVLKKHRLGIVRDLVGHGVGYDFHEDPNIPNYGKIGTGTTLKSGMTIAIEPMATLGGEGVIVETDGWTVTTVDNSLSAHFEHTLLITDDSAEILTQL